MQIVKILIPQAGLFPLDYQVSKEIILSLGDLVIVPFRNKKLTGMVWEINCPIIGEKKLKTIELDSAFNNQQSRFNINPINLELIKKTSDYYLAPLGSVAKLVLPFDINESPIASEVQVITEDRFLPDLSPEQLSVLESINKATKPILLKGVTGSGKTEVYFYLVDECIKNGRQALIMLPEISLGVQIIERFSQRFGFKPAIWNSSITKAKKKKILRGILNGTVKIVIGARSSLFLPYKDLALIVVDEEHDLSYKQGDGILYNARDMAVLKAHLLKAKVLLVSATPSIETIYNNLNSKYEMVVLENRFAKAYLPDIKIIDMRNAIVKKNSWISDQLAEAIKKTTAEGNQSLLFLNRRGYAPLMLCKACGYRFQCSKCSTSMVVHKFEQKMECHHCGFESKIFQNCIECEEKDSLILCGPGIERIEEEAKMLFPDLRVRVISKDQTAKLENIHELLQQMEKGDIDLLIGTQIVTKGYHFPKLALVGVVDADLGFIGGDLRAAERMFQLLSQVSGRAGRTENTKGTVLLQTYFPENKVLMALVSGNEEEFIQRELALRQESSMPPFAKMAAISVSGKNPEKTLAVAKAIVRKAPKSQAKILGPAEALIFRLSGKYRYRLLVIAEKNFNLQKYLSYWLNSCTIPSYVQLKIDIDPYSHLS